MGPDTGSLFLVVFLPTVITPPLLPKEVEVKFGDNATLPCHGPSGAPDQLIVFWQTPETKVLEYNKGTATAASGFQGRATVSRERIAAGDFSLTLHHTTFADGTLYECQSQNATGQVWLTVVAHRDNVTLQAGASLSVPLFTGEPVEVLFDPEGSGDWTSVCSVQNSTASCVPQYRDRVSVENQELRLQELRASDQGSYTVRDLQGNTISTAIVTVEGRHRDLGVGMGSAAALLLCGALIFLCSLRKWKESAGRWDRRAAPPPSGDHGRRRGDTALLWTGGE